MTQEVEKIKKEFSQTNICKMDEDKMLVTGIVLEPDSIDTQGDIIPASEIEKAAHGFMLRSQQIGIQHQEQAPAKVVESYICPIEYMMDSGQLIKKGTWVMTVKVEDLNLWGLVKSGELTGFSIGGVAKRTELV